MNPNDDSYENKRKLEKMYWPETHKEHTIVYILLAVGLLFFLFINQIIGGLVVGLLLGYYFTDEIINYCRNLQQIAGGPDQLRILSATAVLICLLLVALNIIIGAAIGTGVRQSFGNIMQRP